MTRRVEGRASRVERLARGNKSDEALQGQSAAGVQPFIDSAAEKPATNELPGVEHGRVRLPRPSIAALHRIARGANHAKDEAAVIGGMSWDGGAVVAAVALVGGYLRFSMRAMIREENDIQLAKINGTYKRTKEYEVRDLEVERRLEALESRAKVA